ncbi:DUF2509 family protein [Enterobacteriaceae bacterium H18W14]|uniref:DUF2509 family protein n=1 Tax=Dryocola boscaweniae TaxID=2925397 RepID=UPI0022F052BA|nr:DUF2509 family protein [Dryocola boscaweniae]MCT4715429.1 DUF2509 family protein [Dryocola boscaweniae]
MKNLQRGSSSLVFVLLLLSLGILMLNGLQQQLNQQQKAIASEISFLKYYVDAVSALAWGGQQRWQATRQWQCQQQGKEWRACVLLTEKGETLMAAQKLPGQDQLPLTLWRWGSLEDSRWRAAAHGWLDFCPIREDAQCQLPQ